MAERGTWKTCRRFDNMKPKCYGNIVIYELVVVCFALCPGTETVTGRSFKRRETACNSSNS